MLVAAGGAGGGGGRGGLQGLSPEKRAEYQRRMAQIDSQFPPPPRATVKDFVDHIDYAVKLIGIDHVGISSDFDGGGGVEGYNDATEAINVTLRARASRLYGGADLENVERQPAARDARRGASGERLGRRKEAFGRRMADGGGRRKHVIPSGSEGSRPHRSSASHENPPEDPSRMLGMTPLFLAFRLPPSSFLWPPSYGLALLHNHPPVHVVVHEVREEATDHQVATRRVERADRCRPRLIDRELERWALRNAARRIVDHEVRDEHRSRDEVDQLRCVDVRRAVPGR